MTEPSEVDDGNQQWSDALLYAALSWNFPGFNSAAKRLREEKGISIRGIAAKYEHQLPPSTISKNFGENGAPSNANQVRLYVRGCDVSPEEEDQWVVEWERVKAKRPPFTSRLPPYEIGKAQHYLRAMMHLADVATSQVLKAEESVAALSRVASIVYGATPPPAAASVPGNLHAAKHDLQHVADNVGSIKKAAEDVLGLI